MMNNPDYKGFIEEVVSLYNSAIQNIEDKKIRIEKEQDLQILMDKYFSGYERKED